VLADGVVDVDAVRWLVCVYAERPHDHHRVMPAASVGAAGHILAHFLMIMIHVISFSKS
jgi:hypothetical protein